jgi:hypothetical protein
MVTYQKYKKYYRLPDLKFAKLIKPHNTLSVLFFYERGFYIVAVTVNKRAYFIHSETVGGIKTKLRYFGMKPNIKITKQIFLERVV